MTSDSGEVPAGALDLPGLDADHPDEAPENDVLDQRLPPTGHESDPAEDYDLPADADPADVADQHRSGGELDESEYR
ncbi:hypothetical protein [Kribbella sp. NPDC051620]|uniref:hypothetical protein n=1 Tax=Kribbella sp. NPDC051620 TaxID=3364120 RepID=UPI0037A429DC